MCGRFTLKTPPDQWSQLLLPLLDVPKIDLSTIQEAWQPRYNIAPTQSIVGLRADEGGGLIAGTFRWGLVPAWANELSIGNRMINARSETLTEKRSFKGPLEKRRCIVLADGYYEWQKRTGGGKQPYWIHSIADPSLCLAGLWETNRRATGQPIDSCTIITTAANEALHEIHDRMPAVLDADAAARWLSPARTTEEASELLGPAAVERFIAEPVSTYVNNARHEGPQCIAPVNK